MSDDEVARSHPSDPTKPAMAETTLRDADQQVRAFHQAMASLAASDQAYWSLDRVLSWITYRDCFHMNTSYLDGIRYPTMLGVPLVVEPAASSKLLQAVRRAEKPIVCFKDGKEIHGSEWGSVNFPSAPNRWPQGFFAREAVLREWPEPPQAEICGPKPLSASSDEQRLDRIVDRDPLVKQLPENDLAIDRSDNSIKKPTLRGSSDRDIIDIMKSAPVDPPLKVDELIKYVSEQLRAAGKSASDRSIRQHRKHYPALLGKGDHANTLAARKSDKSSSSKSDAD